MATTPTLPPAPDPTQPADSEAYYQKLFDKLGEAYWAANDVDAKDRITGSREAVHIILTAITKAKLEANTSQIVALGGFVDKTNESLKKLQADIASLVHKINLAADVENAIAKVLSLAGKLL